MVAEEDGRWGLIFVGRGGGGWAREGVKGRRRGSFFGVVFFFFWFFVLMLILLVLTIPKIRHCCFFGVEAGRVGKKKELFFIVFRVIGEKRRTERRR